MALHVGNVRPGNLPSGHSRGPCGERRTPQADKVLEAQSPLLTQHPGMQAREADHEFLCLPCPP